MNSPRIPVTYKTDKVRFTNSERSSPASRTNQGCHSAHMRRPKSRGTQNTTVEASRTRARIFDSACLLLALPEPEDFLSHWCTPIMMMELSRASKRLRLLVQQAWPSYVARTLPALGLNLWPPLAVVWAAFDRCAGERDAAAIASLLETLATFERDWPGVLAFSGDLQPRECARRLARLHTQEVAQGVRLPGDALLALVLGVLFEGASPLPSISEGLLTEEMVIDQLSAGGYAAVEERHRWKLAAGWRRQLPLRTAAELSRPEQFWPESLVMLPKLLQVLRIDGRPSSFPMSGQTVNSITVCINGAPGAAANELHVLLDGADMGNGCYGALHIRLRHHHESTGLGWLLERMRQLIARSRGNSWTEACAGVDPYAEFSRWMDDETEFETTELTGL